MELLGIIEWTVWCIAFGMGIFLAWGIRESAAQKLFPPSWPILVTSFYLVALPILFLFTPISKLHIAWIIILLWAMSVKLSQVHIPIVSSVLIWPAYIYGILVTAGTRTSLMSPTRGCTDTSILTSRHLRSLPVADGRLIAESLSSLPDVRLDINEDVLSHWSNDEVICRVFNSADELIKTHADERNDITYKMFTSHIMGPCSWQKQGVILVFSRYNEQYQMIGSPLFLKCIARAEESEWKEYNLIRLLTRITEKD